jgi:hypothetical protein
MNGGGKGGVAVGGGFNPRWPVTGVTEHIIFIMIILIIGRTCPEGPIG